MRYEGGFTLIEALVAGIISVIIPGVVIALLGVNNSELAYNSTRSRLNQIANAVSDDIKATAMGADRVFSTVPAPPACPDAPVPDGTVDGYASFTSAVFCNSNSMVIKSYRVTDIGSGIGQLEERLGAGAWQPFIIGNETVKVDLATDAYQQKSPGVFGIGNDAQFVYFNFHYRMNIGGTVATLPMQTESVVCRNSVSRQW